MTRATTASSSSPPRRRGSTAGRAARRVNRNARTSASIPTAAAAQSAGFRACKRCRPDAAPGSPDWNWRADGVARAMRLIADGIVDREGVPGLAKRLGFSERHLRRLLAEQVGASPVALARAQRANTARLLIESTAMPFADAAFAAGFHSVRQFNDTIRARFRFDAERDAAPVDRRQPPTAGSRRATPELPGAVRRGRPDSVSRGARRARSRGGTAAIPIGERSPLPTAPESSS